MYRHSFAYTIHVSIHIPTLMCRYMYACVSRTVGMLRRMFSSVLLTSARRKKTHIFEIPNNNIYSSQFSLVAITGKKLTTARFWYIFGVARSSHHSLIHLPLSKHSSLRMRVRKLATMLFLAMRLNYEYLPTYMSNVFRGAKIDSVFSAFQLSLG